MAFFVVLGVILAFALGIIARPAAVFAFAVCVFVFEQWAQANSSFFGSHASFMNLAFGVLTLWALICVVLRGGNPLNPIPPAFLVFWALYAYAFASCFWSLDRELSLFVFEYNAPYMVTLSLLMPFVFQKDRDMGDAFIVTLVFGILVMSLMLTGTQIHAWGRTVEATGVVDRLGETRSRLSPLAVADMGGQLLVLAMLMNFVGRRRIWFNLRWIVALLAMALIVRSGTRGQFIASVLTVLACVALARGTKNILGYVAAGVSIGLMLAIGFIGYTAAAEGQAGQRWNIEAMQENFANTRFGMASAALTYWVESSPVNWFLGLGSSASFDPRVISNYCHIVIVEILVELGFVGLFLMLTFLALVGRDAIRLYSLSKDDPEDRGVAIAVIGLFMFQMILTFKQGSFLTHPITWCFGLMVSRQAALKQVGVRTELVNRRRRQWLAYQSWLSRHSHGRPPGPQPAS